MNSRTLRPFGPSGLCATVGWGVLEALFRRSTLAARLVRGVATAGKPIVCKAAGVLVNLRRSVVRVSSRGRPC